MRQIRRRALNTSARTLRSGAIAGFVTEAADCDRLERIATPTAAVKSSQAAMQAEVEEELRQAEEDFARGDFIELTVEQLDRCIAAGVWPWADESSE